MRATPRRRPAPPPRPTRADRPAVLPAMLAVALLPLAGCISDDGGALWEQQPPASPSELAVTWDDPDDARSAHRMTWELRSVATRPTADDGTAVALAWESPSIEGWDHRLTLRYILPGEVPARLTHHPALGAPGTFNLSYEEQPFWAGRTIAGVAAVDGASWVEVTARDPASARFHLAFTGVCGGPEAHPGDRCEQPGADRWRTVLDGSFRGVGLGTAQP